MTGCPWQVGHKGPILGRNSLCMPVPYDTERSNSAWLWHRREEFLGVSQEAGYPLHMPIPFDVVTKFGMLTDLGKEHVSRQLAMRPTQQRRGPVLPDPNSFVTLTTYAHTVWPRGMVMHGLFVVTKPSCYGPSPSRELCSVRPSCS